MPQVWQQHPYGFAGARIKEPDFFRRLGRRQLLPVKGLGACTLIQKETLKVAKYWPYLEDLPSGGMWQGEDRTFSVRANRSHLPLTADAWPDIAHIYRPEDIPSIPEIMEDLAQPAPSVATMGNFVNFSIEPLEEPHLYGKKLHVRGRMGQIKMLPEIEYDLMDLSVGESCISKLNFPLHYELERYSGQTKLVRLTLNDVKLNRPHPGLNRVISDFHGRFYSPAQLDVIRRSYTQ